MNIEIRQETEVDYKISENAVEEAFKDAEHSDHKEHLLVDRLRKREAFIPELSLVAKLDGKIVGHIIFTKILIKNDDEEHESLALAPVSVLPQYQNKGIGNALIIESTKVAKELGYMSIIVLGHDKYYPRFGFKPASRWNIRAPFDVPDESFMALELKEGSLNEVEGIVIYPKEFFE